MNSANPVLEARPHRHQDAASVRVRIASSLADARGIRDVLRSAWRVSDSEPYFYALFNDAERIYRELIEPTMRTDDLTRLNAICLVAEEVTPAQDARQAALDVVSLDMDEAPPKARIVATASLIFCHARREVEFGRGAVHPGARGQQHLWRFVAKAQELCARIPDYIIVSDATLLSRSLGAFAEHVSGPAVAIHASSFTVQRSTAATWKADLARIHGPEIADALLECSPVTGLGRFATGYHVRLPERLKTKHAICRPHLDDSQRPFYEHTRKVLEITPGLDVQRPKIHKMRISDQPHTATRLIVAPPPFVDPAAQMRAASRDGFETLIMQLPCEHHYLAAGRRMLHAGGILSGVLPNSDGRWFASYTFLTTPERRAQVLAGFQRLLTRHAMPDSHTALLAEIIALHCPTDEAAEPPTTPTSEIALQLAATPPPLAPKMATEATVAATPRPLAARHRRPKRPQSRKHSHRVHGATSFHLGRDDRDVTVSADVKTEKAAPDRSGVRFRPGK